MNTPDFAKPTDVDLAGIFQHPAKRYTPVATWWWSGDALEPQRMRWQMERMVEGGIYNLLVLNLAPTGPWSGSVPDEPRFFSPEWWATFRQVCVDARELGMHVWFYDQLGFSSANIQGNIIKDNPTYVGQWLECIERNVEGSAELLCPPEGKPLAAVAIPTDTDGNAIGAPVQLTINGRHLVWSGEGRYRLYFFYIAQRGYDYTSREACRQLLDTVHGAFERNAGDFIGNVIAGTFQDELEAMPTWSNTFAAEFQKRKGYDLLPHLTALYEGDDATAGQVRADFHAVRAELFEAAFFRPLNEWHDQRHLICGFDQHWPIRAGDPVVSTRYFADYLRTHRWYSAPGSDHGGESKIHSSLAHLYNKPRVWMELFHSSGWGGTLEETFDWLLPKLRAGGNLYSPHAIYYSTHGGWWEWAPPSTCWRQPYWRHYPRFSQAVTRLCAVLSQGDHICDVGILYPTATVQDGTTLKGVTTAAQAANSLYHRLVGLSDMVRQNVTRGVLDADRRDFDVLDDTSVQRAEAKDGALCINKEKYRAVVLPGCLVLEEDTAAVLCQFVQTGGLLVAVGALPQRVAGKHGNTRAIEELRHLFATGSAYHVDQPDDVPSVLASLPRQVEAPLPSLLRRVNGQLVLFMPAAFPCATHFNPGWHAGYTFNTDSYAKTVDVTVQGVTTAPELWDPVSGERYPVAATASANAVTVRVPYELSPAALLVWPADQNGPTPDVTVDDEQPMQIARELDGWWDVQLEQTIDNQYGDFDKPNYHGAPPVSTWTFQHRIEGPGEDGIGDGWHLGNTFGGQSETNLAAVHSWQQVQATFGTYAWYTGPSKVAELPLPLDAACIDQNNLHTDGWKPAVYSLSRGIYHDPMHEKNYGPRGFVPEEFLRFGPANPGEGVQCRTTVYLEEAQTLVLAVESAAKKQVWVNGVEVVSNYSGDLWQAPVCLHAGHNTLEFRLVARHKMADLRAYWALVRQPDKFIRPEWMEAPDTPCKGSRVVFSRSLHLSCAVAHAKVQLGSAAGLPCSLWINGEQVARQHGRARIQWYTITNFRQGQNDIEIHVEDPGTGNQVYLDALITGTNGEQIALISAGDWQVKRDNGVAAPVRLGRRSVLHFGMDPRGDALWRRPHPLPEATWLEDQPADDTVHATVPDAFPGQNRVEWLQWIAPPGAVEAFIPAEGELRCFVNGVEVKVEAGKITFAPGNGRPRICLARINPARGRTGGSLLKGPITYTVGAGQLQVGAWENQGLAAHSGGVWYRTTLQIDQLAGKAYWLDLGRVRGTAEVRVNGQLAGVRLWSPFHFCLSAHLQQGVNSIEVLVLNTLAPYLKATSPTPFVFPGQEVSGMMGPVRLLVKDAR